MLKLNSQTEYAFLVLSNVKKSGKPVTVSVLADKLNLPRRYLARICSILVKNKIFSSKEGRNGGYVLQKDLHKIKLSKFLRIFDEKTDFISCSEGLGPCKHSTICHHRTFFKNKLSKIIQEQLKNITLYEVFKNV